MSLVFLEALDDLVASEDARFGSEGNTFSAMARIVAVTQAFLGTRTASWATREAALELLGLLHEFFAL